MKILIVNPPAENVIPEFQDEAGNGFLEAADFGKFPPLGPLYVLSYAKHRFPHHEYFFLDCVGESLTHDDFKQRVQQIVPDLIGFTSFTIALIDVLKAAETAHTVAPSAHLCLGGHHPTAFPIEASGLPFFDSIIVGEGEYAFAGLIEALEKGDDYSGIPGLYTAKSITKFVDTHTNDRRFRKALRVPPAYVEDIDVLPFPDRRFVQHIRYNSIVGLKNRLTTLITSRGCPCKCTFCFVPYKEYRERSMESIMDEIEECVRMGYEEFHFYDDLFNLTPQRIELFCRSLLDRKLQIVWDFRGRVNGLTYDVLKLAKSVGLRLISFGIETGNNEGLALLKKGITIEQIQEVFSWCRKLNILTVADFMIGLPNEKTREDVLKNIDFLIRLNPDYAQVGILNLYPQTEIYDQAVARGIVDPRRWEEWLRNPKPGFYIDHWTEYISNNELIRLHRDSYRRFYLRLPYVIKSIYKLRSLHELQSKTIGAIKLMLTK